MFPWRAYTTGAKMNQTFLKTWWTWTNIYWRKQNTAVPPAIIKSTLAKREKHQWLLNTCEEYLDLYIYENVYKDYHEKVHKLDMYISKSKTENELQKHYPTFITFQCQRKDIIRWGKAKRFLGCEISREKSIIHCTDIYLVPTISSKETYSVEQTIQSPCGHGNCMLVKQSTTVIWNPDLSSAA